ncbi:MAG: exo-alpha-sialidase [Ignavibacteria bacterium]|nr:exo-alpha-sialidase [Ignavibacteria bacterium]
MNSAFRVHPISPPSGHQTEVPITRHPTNPLIMFGSANTSRGGNFSTGWYVTTDGGTNWFGNDTLLNGAGSPVFNFGDPAPIIDGTGRFLISYITLSGQMGASYSINNGVNWSNTVTFPSSTSSSDKNFSSTDDVPTSPNYLRSYTYYTEFASGSNLNRIVGTYTANQGANWTAIAPVSPTPSANHFHQGADTKVGPNGEVYVVWANSSLINPFTEDSLGFAKSTNGGVSWTIARNNVANLNGNRTFNMMNGIRVAGFPRIDVDRTCGPRAGWIYVCVGEKSPGVAGDVSDITLYKSTNGGVNWSTGVRVNQDAFGNGRKQYMGAIRVDESGGVNVVYYDTRNTPTNDSAEVWLSRSTDGGVTFTDMKVGNKFRHAPTGVAGVNGQYAGDYIGITSALIPGNPVNGNQRIWPYWMANNSGLYNAWTAKVELLPSNPCWGCEDFSNTSFTPNYFHLEFTGTQYWTRQTPNAYGAAGNGSAKFDFYNASVVGTAQSLVTNCEPTPAGYYLTFDQAYAPYGNPGFGPDSLYVESSTNNGTSYTKLAGLSGIYPSGGELNTAPGTNASFVPSSSQWAPKIYSLPAGTNRVRLRAVSGFGNNLYIDNVCISTLPTAANSGIGIVPEGMFLQTFPYTRLNDTVRVYLHRSDFPNIKVDSFTTTIDNQAVATGSFSRALSGNYYIEVRHRNTIETWSSAGGVPYNRGSLFNYNFIVGSGWAFDNNQKLVYPGPWYGMFSGDIEQNGFIDLNDVTFVYNDASAFVTGYVKTDVTGDNVTDLNDVLITYNNNADFVSVKRPPGAVPLPAPFIEQDDSQITFENDAVRLKYESGKRHMEEMKNQEPEKITPNWGTNPPEGYQYRNQNSGNNIKVNPEGNLPGTP